MHHHADGASLADQILVTSWLGLVFNACLSSGCIPQAVTAWSGMAWHGISFLNLSPYDTLLAS